MRINPLVHNLYLNNLIFSGKDNSEDDASEKTLQEEDRREHENRVDLYTNATPSTSAIIGISNKSVENG